MLTIKNFEEQIDATMLHRGLQYYKQNAVIDLEETERNTWEADVKGSEIYSVEIKLKSGSKISEYDCDCAYEEGICKHVVAALFAIKEEIGKAGTGQAKAGLKNSFESLLQKITLKEYQDFIRQAAAGDKDFKTEVELYFSDKDDSIDVEKKYTGLIQKIIRKHSDMGYIPYRSAFGLAGDINKLYVTGTALMKNNNFREAFILAKCLVRAMMEAITESDDSNGDIAETIDDAIHLIETIADTDKTAASLKEQIFFFLKTELSNKIYFDYGDFGYELFAVFKKLAIQFNNAEEFLSFIDAQISKLTGEYDNYRKEFFQTEKIAFLKATGKTDEAEKLIQQHLDVTEIRQDEVNKAITKKNYELANQLINDGIKIAKEKEHSGTVSQWQKELLRIAVLEKDIRTIRYYTSYFAFEGWFDTVYYNQWKNTFPAAEWKAVIEALIDEKIKKISQQHQKNKNKFWYQPDPPLLYELAPIYIEEEYWERLLALVQKEDNLETVLQYHAYLAKRFPLEMLAVYLPAIESKGDKASNRNEYADLAAKMKKVIKDIPEGKTKIIAIAQKLKAKYPRRPAMIEELNKILK